MENPDLEVQTTDDALFISGLGKHGYRCERLSENEIAIVGQHGTKFSRPRVVRIVKPLPGSDEEKVISVSGHGDIPGLGMTAMLCAQVGG